MVCFEATEELPDCERHTQRACSGGASRCLLHSSAGHRTPHPTELNQQRAQAPPVFKYDRKRCKRGGRRKARTCRRHDWTQALTTPHHADTSLVMVNAIAENVPMMAMVDLMMSFLAFSMPARMSFTSCTHTRAHTAAPEGRLSKLAPAAACRQHCHQCVHVSQSVRAGQQHGAVLPAHPVHLELKLHSLVTHVLQVVSHAPACRGQHEWWGRGRLSEDKPADTTPASAGVWGSLPTAAQQAWCVRHWQVGWHTALAPQTRCVRVPC